MAKQPLKIFFILSFILSPIFFVQAESPVQVKDYPITEIIKETPKINAQEWHDLQKGEIVLRENTNNLLGGMGIAYVKIPPKKIFEVVTDYSHYLEFMPAALTCWVKESSKRSTLIYAEYKSMWPFNDVILETLNIHDTSDPNHLRMAWKATQTNLKTGWGYWVIQAYEEGSLVFYEMNFDLNWVPRVLAKQSGSQRVIDIVEAIVTRALQNA